METVLRVLKEKQAEMEAALTESDTDKNWIIIVDKLAVYPTVKGDLIQALPHNAERFHKVEAAHFASRCKNGKGVIGHVEYWREATESSIDANAGFIKILTKAIEEKE